MFINWSIRRRLVLIAAALTGIVILIIVVLLLSTTNEALAQQIQTALIERNGHVAEVLDAQLQNIEAMVKVLAAALTDNDASPIATLRISASNLLSNSVITRIGVVRPSGDRYQTVIFSQPGGSSGAPLTTIDTAEFPNDAPFLASVTPLELHWHWAAQGYRAASSLPVIIAVTRTGSTILWVEFPASHIPIWLAAEVNKENVRYPYQLLVGDDTAVFSGYDPKNVPPTVNFPLENETIAALLAESS